MKYNLFFYKNSIKYIFFKTKKLVSYQRSTKNYIDKPRNLGNL